MSTYNGVDNGFVTSTVLPDDGILPDAADVNVPLGRAFDNFANIAARFQRLELGYAIWVHDVEALGPTYVWQQYTLTSYENPASGGYVEIVNAEVNDLILLWATFLCENQGSTSGEGSRVRLAAVDDYLGSPTSDLAIPGARAYIEPAFGAVPVTLFGRHIVTAAGHTRIKVQGRVNNAGEFMRIQSIAQIFARHLRLT